MPRVARWALGALIAVNLLLAGAYALRPAGELGKNPFTEDAYYALSVSRNVALGQGITIDGAIETNGFQPLWTFLNAPAFLLASGDRYDALRLSLVLSTLIWIAFAALMAVVVRDRARDLGLRGDVAAAASLLVVFGSVSVFRLFHNGLETGLQLLALAAAVLLLDRTDRWTARRTLLMGAVLGVACYARLDLILFAIAVGAVAARGGLRERRMPWAPLAACAIAALLLSPWLARNVALSGALMPTSGSAQTAGVQLRGHYLDAGVRALGAWSLPPLLRPRMHPGLGLWPLLAGLVGLGAFGASLAWGRRRAGRIGPGTVALWLYMAAIFVYYTLAFGAFWFLDRYLAPMLVVALPWIACAAEGAWVRHCARRVVRGGWAFAAVVALVGAVNLPVALVALRAPSEPPAWASTRTNLGSHSNSNFADQTMPILDRVDSRCVVGARQSGTLGYFRDRVVNLDGKVNLRALRAIGRGDLRGYVDSAGVHVFIDDRRYVDDALGSAKEGFALAATFGDYELWVREGAERCVSRLAPRA